jgi:hypothetical protein
MNHLRRHFTSSLSVLGTLLFTARYGDAFAQNTPAAREAAALPLPSIGSALTLPEVSLFDGSVFKPQQAKGHVTVIYWWSSTCPFCAQQSPEIEKLWRTQKARGLNMLGLSVDQKPAEAMAYLQKKGYTFPSGWVTPEIHNILSKPRGLPVTIVLGRDGRVLQAEKGQLFPEDVAQLANWL